MMATTELCNTYPENDVWGRVSTHYKAAYSFGRRAVEEAWRCGDALIAAKAETKHGDWLPALRVAGIAHETAKRFMRLRRAYPEIDQVGLFESVSAALQLPQAQQEKPLEPSVRDPQPIFDTFEKLEDLLPNHTSKVGLHFCVWFVTGDGIKQWIRVYSSVQSYASAIASAFEALGQENQYQLCRDADTLRQSTILIVHQYIDQARARAVKDAQPPGGGA